MQLIKPMSMGYMTKTFRDGPRHVFSVAAIGFYEFESPRVWLYDTALWPFAAEQLAGAPIDFAMPKASAEYLVAGKAMPPSGEAVQAMDLQVRVGALHKTLKVFGDRQWRYREANDLFVMTPPRPFEEMPITWHNAFGGERVPENRVGKGGNARARALSGEPVLLPNVEDPRQLITDIRARPAPAGLMPVDIEAESRRAKAGTFDRDWLINRFPGLPADADWSLHNMAPPDQWSGSWFAAGDPIAVAGMSRDAEVVRTTVTDLVPRCFIERRDATEERISELRLRLETIWLFPNFTKVACFFRAAVEVRDPDAEDVATLLLAYESPDDAPRPVEHYVELIRRRRDPRVHARNLIADHLLTPERSAEAIAARDARRTALREEIDRRHRERFQLLKEDFEPMLGGHDTLDLGIDPRPLPSDFPVFTAEDIANREVDVGALIDFAERQLEPVRRKQATLREDAEAEHAAMDAEWADFLKAMDLPPEATAATPPEDAPAMAPEDAPAGDVDEALERARRPGFAGTIDAFMAELRAREVPAADMFREPGADVAAAVQPFYEEAAKAARFARLQSPEATMPQRPLSPDAAHAIARLLVDDAAAGATLVARDFAGAALRGADLSGLDLHGILFEKADLRDVRFAGADLTEAVFAEADLSGADLSGSTLDRANLGRVRAHGACFRRASLVRTMLFEADLTGADLSGVRAELVLAYRARLGGALLAGAVLDEPMLLEADLTGADLCGARITRATLLEAKLTGARLAGASVVRSMAFNVTADDADFAGADLTKFYAGGTATFRNACFSGARGPESGWRGVDMTGADLRDAVLVGADLTGAVLRDACLFQAALRGARMGGADLVDADLRRADLFGALLRKARLTRAELRESSLYGAELLFADLQHADLSGAFLKRSRLML